MKALFVVLAVSVLSTFAQAEVSLIPLSAPDQARLTKELSKIDVTYRTREVVQEAPYLIIKNTYSFLTSHDAVFIQCSEEFVAASTLAAHQQCVVGFNYEASVAGKVEAHDGFMPEFAVAQINDSATAKILYQAVGKGLSSSAFFNTAEQIVLTHPKSGQKFPASRLRIDCQGDNAHQAFQCNVSGVK